MNVGILTGPFGNEPLEAVAAFAAEYGFRSLEVATGPGSKHIDTAAWTVDRSAEVSQLMERRALQISSLAAYTNLTDGDAGRRARNVETVMKAIDIAADLNVEVVCTLAGLPPAGKDRFKVIAEDCTVVFPPILKHARSKGIKIALENWYATNIQHLGHWDELFRAVPDDNFGLNFDPSHLLWQGIDYIAAVDHFASRIFHTHAKDTEISERKRDWVGVLGDGWWRYVIPGLGQVRWGEYIAALRRNQYNGVLSIEHEDGAVEREEGFLIGKKYLEQFIAG
ncbi:MAG: sugar phosphate isomerase/epimerase [Armatimonadetes bacterium]|nr:sugar phosphate isomerase/epimerase [Armatimonadota bacterium]MDE2205760.1 sugar phosphate isomerase/epimerase [Armatimonadota bacterium]